jgi:LPS sulfotransferase NodH
MRPHISYLICATHRTGSTLLCEALKNTCLAGRPEEYFWCGYEPRWSEIWGSRNYTDYLTRAVEWTMTPNGVFGAKLMWAHFDDFLTKVRQLPGYTDPPTPELLSAIFPNLHYIWITRRDKVRQAVSLWKAVQTQIWEQRTEELLTLSQEPIFDFEAIDRWLHDILRQEAAWQQYFAESGITPFTVVYEDFATAYEATAIDILRYLNITVPTDLVFGERELKQQADVQSEIWVQRYCDLKRELTEQYVEPNSDLYANE